MVFLKQSDYESESKRFKPKYPRRARFGGVKSGTHPNAKLPTKLKSKRKFCRNCLNELKPGEEVKPCPQCEKITVPLNSRH